MKINLMALLAGVVMLSACSYFRSIEPWDGRLYVGDSKSASLMREQDPVDTMKCSDARFDDMVCMSKADFGAWIANYKAYRAQCPQPSESPDNK